MHRARASRPRGPQRGPQHSASGTALRTHRCGDGRQTRPRRSVHRIKFHPTRTAKLTTQTDDADFYTVLYAAAAGAPSDAIAQDGHLSLTRVKALRRHARNRFASIRSSYAPPEAINAFHGRYHAAEDDAEATGVAEPLDPPTNPEHPHLVYRLNWTWMNGWVRLDGNPIIEPGNRDTHWVTSWRALARTVDGSTVMIRTYCAIAIDRMRQLAPHDTNVLQIEHAPVDLNWLWELYIDENTKITTCRPDTELAKPVVRAEAELDERRTVERMTSTTDERDEPSLRLGNNDAPRW